MTVSSGSMFACHSDLLQRLVLVLANTVNKTFHAHQLIIIVSHYLHPFIHEYAAFSNASAFAAVLRSVNLSTSESQLPSMFLHGSVFSSEAWRLSCLAKLVHNRGNQIRNQTGRLCLAAAQVFEEKICKLAGYLYVNQTAALDLFLE